MAEEVQEISDHHGRYLITTEASCYLVDLRAGTLVRVPDAGLGSVASTRVGSAVLRGDHLPLRLLECRAVRVGERAVFLLDLRGDGVLTCRVSTPVRRIEAVPR